MLSLRRRKRRISASPPGLPNSFISPSLAVVLAVAIVSSPPGVVGRPLRVRGRLEEQDLSRQLSLERNFVGGNTQPIQSSTPVDDVSPTESSMHSMPDAIDEDSYVNTPCDENPSVIWHKLPASGKM
jgi:hypothetical protein